MSDPLQKTANNYKVVIAGGANTGKSCFIHRHLTGKFAENCQPTPQAVSLTLAFDTSRGRLVFDLWDVPGSEKAPAIWDHFNGARGLLAFYDASAKSSINAALALVNAKPGIPAVLCGGKADLLGNHFALGAWSSPPSLPHVQISSKNDYDLDKPFLALARSILDDPQLSFIEKRSPNAAEALLARLPAAPEIKRLFLVVSELSFGTGLRGVFDNLAAARAFAKHANVNSLNFAIISYLPNMPGSEVFIGAEN